MKSKIIIICNKKYRIKKCPKSISVLQWEGSSVGGRWVKVCDKMRAIVIADALAQDSKNV